MADETLAPGSRWWWAERDTFGRIVHLSLVEVVGPTYPPGSYSVASVRSGRSYVAAHGSLLPVGAVVDPLEVCATCGRSRDNHRVRHLFKAKETPTP